MRYDLYKGAIFIATHDDSEWPDREVPALDPNKGRLLKVDPPPFDPETETCAPVDVTEGTEGEIGFVVAERPLADRRVALKARAAAIRFVHETGGLTIGDTAIDTARDSQALITGAYTAAKNGVLDSVDFKAVSGWATLTGEQIIAIGEAVAVFVQACFSREMALSAAIDAAGNDETGSHAALSAIDLEADWPV